MHKRFVVITLLLGLFLSVVFSFTANAASPGEVVISEILTGTEQSASAEYVMLHNQTANNIDVTGWKIQYLSATGTAISVRATLSGTLAANGSLLASTNDFSATHDALLNSGMPETGGRLRVIDAAGAVIDSLSWGSGTTPSEGVPASAPKRGQVVFRVANQDSPTLKDTNDNSADFLLDACLNINDNQQALPEGYQLDANGDCVVIPSLPAEYAVIQLNEILPDPGSPKTDADDEFIELYNSNDTEVDVTGYRITSGTNLTSVYTLPTYTIPAHGYLTLYSSETKISLTNSGGKLQLQSPDMKPMGDILQYGAVGTDQVWAYTNGEWKLSDKATPNAENEIVTISEVGGMGGGDVTAAPCPEGKYRNPLTNRCRSIEADVSVLATCADDEYRSPDTNRCRKAVLATATITPCSVGQERNPETNRCRKVAGDTTTLKPCDPGQERNPDTGRCRKVSTASRAANVIDQPKKQGLFNTNTVVLGAVGVLAIGYGVYEWRSEIGGMFGRLVATLGKK